MLSQTDTIKCKYILIIKRQIQVSHTIHVYQFIYTDTAVIMHVKCMLLCKSVAFAQIMHLLYIKSYLI